MIPSSVRSFHLEFREYYCLARRLCANLIWNLLKVFIEEKITDELPMETQCFLPEEGGECQKHPFFWGGGGYENLILYPVVRLRPRHTLTCL